MSQNRTHPINMCHSHSLLPGTEAASDMARSEAQAANIKWLRLGNGDGPPFFYGKTDWKKKTWFWNHQSDKVVVDDFCWHVIYFPQWKWIQLIEGMKLHFFEPMSTESSQHIVARAGKIGKSDNMPWGTCWEPTVFVRIFRIWKHPVPAVQYFDVLRHRVHDGARVRGTPASHASNSWANGMDPKGGHSDYPLVMSK